MVANALNNGQLVISLPFSPDASLLQVEASAPTSNPLPQPSSTQTIVTKSNGKSGTSVTAGTGITPTTVTGGKKFYMTSFAIYCQGGAYQSYEVRDGGSGGTLKIVGSVSAANNNTQIYTFPTPIEFSTDVWIDVGSTQTIEYCYNGFEA